jgi:threonine dehydratase
MSVAFKELKLVVEPGGTVALAAVLAGKVDVRGRVVAVTATGGNVDPSEYRQALAED